MMPTGRCAFESQPHGAHSCAHQHRLRRFSVSLHADGTLYIAVHSGRGFFDVGKGKEPPDALRRRFTREIKWCTDMIDVFRPAAE